MQHRLVALALSSGLLVSAAGCGREPADAGTSATKPGPEPRTEPAAPTPAAFGSTLVVASKDGVMEVELPGDVAQ